MALTDEEQDILRRLTQQIGNDQRELLRLDAYYEGQQNLTALGLAVPEDLRFLTTIVNWPRIGVDSVEERLDIEGFRYPSEERARARQAADQGDPEAAAEVDQGADDDEDSDQELWRIWQANDLDEESQLAHLDALIQKRSYTCVGTNEDDDTTPLVTVESPLEMGVLTDARTREVTDALRLFDEGDDVVRTRARYATLYRRGVTVQLERGRRSGWVEVDRDEHGLELCPVTPLVNRPRIRRRSGASDIEDVISLTDAAARSLTNLQLAGEALAVPQRGVIGASKGDFVDEHGKPLPVWAAYFGAIWALENPNAKTFQFAGADLRNFHDTVLHYARLVSALTGLPPHYLGFAAENPPSADAIRSSESRLVKRAERKQRFLGGGWERTMRVVKAFQGDDDPRAKQIETLWRDPATPTAAEAGDRAVKLYQAKILPLEATWEDLGYSATRRRRLRRQMEEDQQRNAANDPVTGLADRLRQAAASGAAPVGTAGDQAAAAAAVAGGAPAAAAPGATTAA